MCTNLVICSHECIDIKFYWQMLQVKISSEMFFFILIAKYFHSIRYQINSMESDRGKYKLDCLSIILS